MWQNKNSIQAKFFKNMIFIALVSIGLWSLTWIQSEYSDFRIKSKSIRANYLESQKKILKTQVSGVVKYINDMQRLSEQKLELNLKERVYEAHQIAMSIYRQNIDSKNSSEIKKMIKDALRPVRFNGDRGYYFAVSMDGIEQLFPVDPKFEGKNLIGLKDSRGSFVIQDEIKIIKEKGEGFVKHFWMKPGKDPSDKYPKISFVKYFKPLNWYFGTGEYLDDAKRQIQDEVLNHIIQLRFGKEGYFFGSTYQGNSLFSNGRILDNSVNIMDLTDPNGVKIIQEQIKMAKTPGGGFVYYSWKKLNTNYSSPKISFVRGISDWGWTIGAGVYLDTIEKTISKNKAVLIKGLKKRITRSALILAVLLCLIYFWSKHISNQIQNSIKIFSSYLKKTDPDKFMINPDDIQLQEFNDIAVLTGNMLERVRQAESTLKKNEEKYRLLIENQNDMVVKFDTEGSLQFVSQSFCTIFRKTRGELIGKKFMPLIHNNDTELADNAYADIFKSPYSVKLENRVMTKDGWRWQEWHHTAVLNNDKKVKSIIAVGRDIDDRKKIEIELKKSEKQFQDLFNSIKDLVYTQDMEGRFISVNPSMHKLFGYEIKEFIGKKGSDFMEPKFVSAFNNQYLKVLKKQGYYEGIGCYFKKDTKKIYIEYNSSLVKPDSGTPYISGIGRDVTERILSRKKVKRLQQQIAQSQKMESIGTLAGGIAHDFNNILFPIIGYTEMMIEDVPAESPLRASLEQIYKGAMRARDLVKQILTFSRQESGEMKLMKIQPVIKEALKLIRSTIPATIEIKQDIQSECGLIKADPTQIHQIIINLATNAYHAMEDTGGELNVSLKQMEYGAFDLIKQDMIPGIYACLTIEDSGTGMDKALIDKIFDPFFTTKENGKGTGMGLSVVHGIVHRMRGDIQVYSEPGKGTKVHVYLPVLHNFSEEQAARSITKIQGGMEHILFIDDEEAILTMGKKMLERLGYRVTSYTKSLKALEVFRENPNKFDLVITDMAMPSMPGDKLSIELSKIRSDIPILLCSGFSENMSEKKAISLGIKGFLFKPIRMKDFSQKIREVLDKKRNLV